MKDKDPEFAAWLDGLLTNTAEPYAPALLDVSDEAGTLRWLKAELGCGPLAGIFRRGRELVYTPRVGEHGYVPPKDDRDHAGPAQVRRIDALELAGRIDHAHGVIRGRGGRCRPCLFPLAVAARALSNPDLLPNVRDLVGVTHTPVIRADGSVLDEPGYDEGMLYLPDTGPVVPKVSEYPTRAEVGEAGVLLLGMLADFPFVTPHDRANFLGALLTPPLRPLVPPPYKLIVLGAPQRGSGKSLLAWIARELHGGVFKAEFPADESEARKFITSTLDATTGPVVVFDNVTGVLKSGVLDGLLTMDKWSDRPLGRTAMLMDLRNDRVWMVTGNNVHIGGDLVRRSMRVTINANMEHPERRNAFAIPDLQAWVRAHRGDLLWALLTLIRAWVVAGAVEGPWPTSDSYGRWVAVLRGILAHAELGPSVGLVDHPDTAQGGADPEEEEWAAFLAAAHRVFGSEPWTAADIVEQVGRTTGLTDDELPGDIADKVMRPGGVAAKSLGRWLSFRDGRWAGGLSVRSASGSSGKHAKSWRIVEPEG